MIGSERSACDTGLFTWEIASNILFADSALARLFGLDPDKTVAGLPLQDYLERVHPADRGPLAASIHDAILSGQPCHQEYRVKTCTGSFVGVTCLGRCFKGTDGVPSHYVGIVFATTLVEEENPLLQACAVAYRMAMNDGRMDVAGKLQAALETLISDGEPPQRGICH